MSMNHDNVKAKLGCGEYVDFSSIRAFTMWLKLHKKKCDPCSRANVNTMNIVARDHVSNTNVSRENYRQINEAVANTMQKGVELKKGFL
jgi:hypothetical protein